MNCPLIFSFLCCLQHLGYIEKCVCCDAVYQMNMLYPNALLSGSWFCKWQIVKCVKSMSSLRIFPATQIGCRVLSCACSTFPLFSTEELQGEGRFSYFWSLCLDQWSTGIKYIIFLEAYMGSVAETSLHLLVVTTALYNE